MKIPAEDIAYIILPEINNNSSLDGIFAYIRKHPLIKNYLGYYSLGDLSEIVYIIFAKINNFDERKLQKLLDNRIFYIVVQFSRIYEDESKCGECDGDGIVDCNNCAGTGTNQCNNCDGTGEVDDGEETVECNVCYGSGEIECNVCYGDRNEECGNCGGSGVDQVRDYMDYSYNLCCDVQPETIRYDMERSEELVDDFDDEIENSKYKFDIKTSDYRYELYEDSVTYNNDFGDRDYFYEVVNPNENILDITFKELP